MRNLTIITSKSITFNRFLLEISNSLSNNFKITLCCRDTANIDNLNNLSKEDIPFPNSLIDLFDIKKLYKIISKIFKIINQSDLIYLHTPLASHFVRLIYIFSLKKIKIIYHVHGLRYMPGTWNFEGLFYRLLEFIFSFKTDKFIAINNMDYNSMKKFVPCKKIYLVKGVGVNLKSNFKIKTYKNRNQKFVVGVIAAFKKSKGFKELVKIAKNCESNKNVIFKVFGYGNYSWIEDLIRNHNINNIEIKGYKKNIEDEIEQFNLFLLPSHREGLNVSIQECLSKGKPVLATKVRGCEDLIIEGYNGFLYNKEDICKASTTILKLSEMNIDDYSKLCKNSFEYARNNLSREIKNKQILEIFNEYYV